METHKKSINRSNIRLFLGKTFYTYRRYMKWYITGIKFVNQSTNTNTIKFTYLYIKHSTPLLRQLKDVDMYLQYNKITNLSIAIKKIDGVIINPGEVFSYWKLIGKPSKRKGYKDGMVLSNGGFIPGIGGGLCQLSNLLFWMILHTPLTVIERHRHSYDVFPDSNRILPFGSGATCCYNYKDLMIKNETTLPFLIKLTLTKEDLIGTIQSIISPNYTYEIYEKEHYMKTEYLGGYSRHNSLFRKVYDINHVLVSDEYLFENHALMMYNPFITDNTMDKT